MYQEPSEEFPMGLIVTGCEEGWIQLFDPVLQDYVHELKAHAGVVTSLFVGK